MDEEFEEEEAMEAKEGVDFVLGCREVGGVDLVALVLGTTVGIEGNSAT